MFLMKFLKLTHFQSMFHFYTPLKHQEVYKENIVWKLIDLTSSHLFERLICYEIFPKKTITVSLPLL